MHTRTEPGMRAARLLAGVFLVAVLAAAWWPGGVTSSDFAEQFRQMPDAPISRQFPLGTDELGRDRLSRLLYGTRISLLAAPAAALLATFLAALVGGAAGFLGGWVDRILTPLVDLMLSLPWLFLLIMVRALLPLNASALVSIVVTFGLIAVLGWPSAARVVRAACIALRDSDLVLYARASGLSPGRILWKHVVPNVKPVLLAQFWASIPIFVLAEANLGLLGLGVADPTPSWGNLLRPLGAAFLPAAGAWAPLALMLLVVSCLYVLRSKPEVAQ